MKMNIQSKSRGHYLGAWLMVGVFLLGASASLASDADELAKKLSNPVAALISVPFQYNMEFGNGNNDDGYRHLVNIQPVVPISVTSDMNLISRTILPVTYQKNYAYDGGWSQLGTGDIVQSLFLSPVEPTAGGMIWGVGPVFLLPTASKDVLGSEKWGLGPTGVALIQNGPWTYGALVNHIFSFAGDDNRRDVSATFLQPFCSYGLGGGWTLTANTESTYDWERDQWTIPLALMASRVVQIRGNPMSFGGGLRNYVEGPDSAPDWGLRFIVTLLFPK